MKALCQGAIFFTLFFCPVLVTAESKKDVWSYGIQSELLSRYVFRGLDRYRGLSLHQDVNARYGLSKKSELVVDAKVHVPLQSERDGTDFTAVIASGIYKLSPGAGDVIVGGNWYGYSGGEIPAPGNTGEIFGILAFSAVLNPSFSLFQDIDETHGRYFELGLSEELATDYYDPDVIFVPFIHMGFAFHTENTLYAGSGFNHVAYGLKARHEMNTWTFFVTLTHMDGADAQVKSLNWAGIGAEYLFD